MTEGSSPLTQAAELAFLNRLRERYEAEGFSFIARPVSSQLPSFMQSYIPDAIASKGSENVAIEVKRQRFSDQGRSLQSIRRLLETQPGWRLDVALMGGDPLATDSIRVPSPREIRARVGQVRSLAAAGHQAPAFIMAWSLLEASLTAVRPDAAGKAYRPATVLERLAMEGYLPPKLQESLRDLIPLQNRLVHGDLDAEPRKGDVEVVLSAIAETLDAAEEEAEVL